MCVVDHRRSSAGTSRAAAVLFSSSSSLVPSAAPRPHRSFAPPARRRVARAPRAGAMTRAERDTTRAARREPERGAPSELAAHGFARLMCFFVFKARDCGCGSVAHARRDPLHTHTTGLRAVTSPPAAPPRPKRQASAAVRISVSVCCFMAQWGSILLRSSIFPALLSRDAAKTRVRSRLAAKNQEARKKGRCFVFNQANGALPQFPRPG